MTSPYKPPLWNDDTANTFITPICGIVVTAGAVISVLLVILVGARMKQKTADSRMRANLRRSAICIAAVGYLLWGLIMLCMWLNLYSIVQVFENLLYYLTRSDSDTIIPDMLIPASGSLLLFLACGAMASLNINRFVYYLILPGIVGGQVITWCVMRVSPSYWAGIGGVAMAVMFSVTLIGYMMWASGVAKLWTLRKSRIPIGPWLYAPAAVFIVNCVLTVQMVLISSMVTQHMFNMGITPQLIINTTLTVVSLVFTTIVFWYASYKVQAGTESGKFEMGDQSLEGITKAVGARLDAKIQALRQLLANANAQAQAYEEV